MVKFGRRQNGSKEGAQRYIEYIAIGELQYHEQELEHKCVSGRDSLVNQPPSTETENEGTSLRTSVASHLRKSKISLRRSSISAA